MSKRSLDTGDTQKSVRLDLTANSQDDPERLIEMAAEQLADLLWKCWLAGDGLKVRTRKSNTRTNGARVD